MPVLFWVPAGKFFVVFYCADWTNINWADINWANINPADIDPKNINPKNIDPKNIDWKYIDWKYIDRTNIITLLTANMKMSAIITREGQSCGNPDTNI